MRLSVAIAVAIGFAVVAGANAHLVYVALTSEPGCVPHVRSGESAPGRAFGAAQSACTPSR
ncbi:hypothetical protein SLNSH_06340 [Alsobacter soli]|uniref:Uncharacterized protein n=1 Tax=Alsobacter soli TaxID=2109933 RepID=A0A2T1HWS1_9HYPH|nr:hypothetical protein SLNSH_06340 [Alsobacter soli]